MIGIKLFIVALIFVEKAESMYIVNLREKLAQEIEVIMLISSEVEIFVKTSHEIMTALKDAVQIFVAAAGLAQRTIIIVVRR